MSFLFSMWTVLVCAVFLGVAWWAWQGARKPEFDTAARIPLDDDEEVRSNDHAER